MEIGKQVAIYLPTVGKKIPKPCLALGYFEKSLDAEYENRKAEADSHSEIICALADVEWNSSWVYKGTQVICGREYHHYSKVNSSKEDHLWVTTDKAVD